VFLRRVLFLGIENKRATGEEVEVGLLAERRGRKSIEEKRMRTGGRRTVSKS